MNSNPFVMFVIQVAEVFIFAVAFGFAMAAPWVWLLRQERLD